MTDLPDLFQNLVADLGGSNFPLFPTSKKACGNSQAIGSARISHISHISHNGNGSDDFLDLTGSDYGQNKADEPRASSSPVSGVGNVGNVGKVEKPLAASDTSHFPHSPSFVGKKEEEWEIPKPQAQGRAEWLDDATLVALAPQLLPSPAEDDLPIAPATVRAALEREIRALARLGLTGAEAQARAVEITRAKVRNAPALATRQLNTSLCAVCGSVLDDTEIVISVLSGGPARVLHIHERCHDEHRRRLTADVERIMTAAGFGPNPSETAP